MCMPNGNSFMCKCQPGFTGQKCDTRDPCTPNPVILSFYYFNLKLFNLF